MTGTFTQNSVFSRITFSFLEDTGWYQADYSYAQDFVWGKNLGCDFVKKSCKSWIDEKSKSGMESVAPYCKISTINSKHNTKYECDSKREAVLLCNAVVYEDPLPPIYRNFDRDDHLGGSVILADYCPFMQQVSWSSKGSTRDSTCIFEDNEPRAENNYLLENYGDNSKCFNHNSTWSIYVDNCKSMITVHKTIGCYNVNTVY
jgi:leishmanolysin-like peptidase